MITKAGLIGLFQAPKYREQIAPVYMIADGDTSSLFIFVLFPGAYDDAFEVASQVEYHHIFIIPTSMEAMYISDVYRLSNDLTPVKASVNVIYPTKFPMHVPPVMENSLLKGSPERTTAFVYQNGFIAFDWGIEKPIENPIYHRGFHDIYINFNDRRVLFCPHEVNKERILTLLKNGDVDYVYVPYSKPMFGDESYTTLIQDEDFAPYIDNKYDHDNIIAFGFANSTEAKLCWENHPNAFPVTFRWLFLNAYDWESDEVNYVSISDRPWSPHYYPKKMYPYPLERYDLGLSIDSDTVVNPPESSEPESPAENPVDEPTDEPSNGDVPNTEPTEPDVTEPTEPNAGTEENTNTDGTTNEEPIE